MSAQNSVASKSLSKSSMQARQPSAYLSRIELVLCCMLLVQSIHAVWDGHTHNALKYIATFAHAFGILTDQLKAFEASKNTASVLRQIVSSDLLIAVAQQATLHLRDNITVCHHSVDHIIGVLVEVACLDLLCAGLEDHDSGDANIDDHSLAEICVQHKRHTKGIDR